MKHLDEPSFVLQAGGHPALMLRIARAFVGQLPAWRAEFMEAANDPARLSPLLHKMKGSCHAISAPQAALAFECAEAAVQVPGFAASPTGPQAGLLSLIAEIEAELHDLIGRHEPPGQAHAEAG